MKRIKAFTHTDLDGVGSGIVFQNIYGKENVDVTYCDYDNVNERIKKFLDEEKPTDYAAIFITDISVDEEVAETLDLLHRGKVTKVVLLDHHDTAKWLNKYEWAVVEPIHSETPLRKSSGTSLIIDWFDNEGGYELSHGIRHFADTVRKYDTWEWYNIYDEILPKELNDYLYMVGKDKFVKLMLATIPSNDPGKEVYFDVTARAILDQRQREIKDYIRIKNEQMEKVLWDADEDDNDLHVGVVFAEQHVSELGNELCNLNPDILFVVIVDAGKKKLSFRTIRDDIHLGEIAKRWNGGGHPKAAGGQIRNILMDSIIDNILS